MYDMTTEITSLCTIYIVVVRIQPNTDPLCKICPLIPDSSLMSINQLVNLSNAEQYCFDVDLTLTVAEFKSFSASKIGIGPHQQQITYRGRVLEDSDTLMECGLQENTKIQLICLPEHPRTPSRDSNTYEPSIYSGLPGCNNDADHNLSSINHMSPYYIAYRIELYRKTVCDIEILVWHCPLTDTMEIAVGREFYPLCLDHENLKSAARNEYIRESLRGGAVLSTVTYRKELFQNAKWLENYLVLSYVLERLEVCQSAYPSERSAEAVESSPSCASHDDGSADGGVKFEIRFLPRLGDETYNPLMRIPPTACPIVLKRSSLSAYRAAIDQTRAELKSAVEGLAAILPATSTHRCLVNQQGSVVISTQIGTRGRPILTETHEQLLEECATSNLRGSFRLKYLNHLRHFVFNGHFSEDYSCAGVADVTMDKTEILKRLDAFRMSMNATAQKGVFGKLIVSDLSESKFINPSETLRRKLRAQYHREGTISSSSAGS